MLEKNGTLPTSFSAQITHRIVLTATELNCGSFYLLSFCIKS